MWSPAPLIPPLCKRVSCGKSPLVPIMQLHTRVRTLNPICSSPFKHSISCNPLPCPMSHKSAIKSDQIFLNSLTEVPIFLVLIIIALISITIILFSVRLESSFTVSLALSTLYLTAEKESESCSVVSNSLRPHEL